jgi:hypothetical protein
MKRLSIFDIVVFKDQRKNIQIINNTTVKPVLRGLLRQMA